MNFDVSIIGAGICGCYLASLISNEFKTCIIEEHKEIGKPLQCAGLVSDRILEICNFPKETILNEIKGAVIHFPNRKEIKISGNEKAFVIDRISLDRYFFKIAEHNGVKLINGRYKSHKIFKNYAVLKINNLEISSKIIVNASGPRRKESIVGIQARVKIERNKDFVELFLNKEITKDFFAWIIPEGNGISKIGIGTNFSPRKSFEKFLKFIGIKENEIIDRQAGLIPISKFRDTSFERGFFLGDAANQVKATTGGGIVTGLISSNIAAKAIKLAFQKRDFSKKFFSRNYDKKWKEKIGRDLNTALLIRKVLNKLNNKDLNELYEVASSEEFKEILSIYGDMDFPTRFIFKLFRNKKFLSFLIKRIPILLQILF